MMHGKTFTANDGFTKDKAVIYGPPYLGGNIVNSPSDLVSPIVNNELPKERFGKLSKEWYEKSRFMSSTTEMCMLESYQKIIGMGWSAVPLILEELKVKPAHWSWALQSITDKNPVPKEYYGKVRKVAQCWVNWGKQHNIIK